MQRRERESKCVTYLHGIYTFLFCCWMRSHCFNTSISSTDILDWVLGLLDELLGLSVSLDRSFIFSFNLCLAVIVVLLLWIISLLSVDDGICIDDKACLLSLAEVIEEKEEEEEEERLRTRSLISFNVRSCRLPCCCNSWIDSVVFLGSSGAPKYKHGHV